MIVTPGSPEMEVVVVLDGEMFKHMATDIWDAKSWLEQYPLSKPGCKARIWYRLAGAQRLH